MAGMMKNIGEGLFYSLFGAGMAEGEAAGQKYRANERALRPLSDRAREVAESDFERESQAARSEIFAPEPSAPENFGSNKFIYDTDPRTTSPQARMDELFKNEGIEKYEQGLTMDEFKGHRAATKEGDMYRIVSASTLSPQASAIYQKANGPGSLEDTMPRYQLSNLESMARSFIRAQADGNYRLASLLLQAFRSKSNVDPFKQMFQTPDQAQSAADAEDAFNASVGLPPVDRPKKTPTKPKPAPPPAAPGAMIRVRRKSDGKTGQIPAASFNPQTYTKE